MKVHTKHETQVFKGIFDEDTLSHLSTLINQHIDTLSDKDILPVTQGKYYPVGNEAASIINKVLPLLPNEQCGTTLLKHTGPTGVHTDTNLSDEDLLITDLNTFARTFIIPLKTLDTYTITFNEFLTPGTPGKEVNSYIANLPATNKITSDDIEKYFTVFKKQDWIRKLSIETIFPWVAGDVLVFDRNRLHTGDDHLSNNIVKEGIVVWTTIS